MIRTFISVDVPLTEEIRDILSELKGCRNVKAANPEQIHLTLKFLGDTDEKKVERLCQSLRIALDGKGPFDVTVEGTGAFPNEKNPRVVWLGIKDPERMIEIADAVDSCVKALRIKADDKRFSPHITVGRVNGKAELKDIFDNNKEKVFCTFSCDHVDVMKSVLTPKGAIHSVIESIRL